MTTKSIYEIQTDYLNLFEKVEESLSNPELTSEELQKLESELELNRENFKDKATNYVKFIQSLDNDNLVIDNEIKRLTTMKKKNEMLKNNLFNRLQQAFNILGFDKFDLGLFKLSFRKSTAVNTKEFEDVIISDLNNKIDFIGSINSLLNNFRIDTKNPITKFLRVKVEIEPDKAAIKEFISENKQNEKAIKCFIQDNKKLQIK